MIYEIFILYLFSINIYEQLLNKVIINLIDHKILFVIINNIFYNFKDNY